MKTPIPLFFIIFSLTGFAFLPTSQAVVPAPDGAYAGGNTAEGHLALASLNTSAGLYNTAVGVYSLLSITDGDLCTALGAGTLFANNAPENTATGAGALFSNTTGEDNTAHGAFALFSNTTGTVNTAIGDSALLSNTDGNFNTAVGQQALFANTSGQENTAVGFVALANNTVGNVNTAIGGNALFSSTGSGNIALGHNAGGSVTTASNVICIGTSGANIDNSCFIGQIYFNVQPTVGTDPDSVTITSAGRLGRGNVSSRRYKHDIKPMDKASEALYALKPVSFHYNKEYDATQTLAFGLVAEEVAEVYPDLVGRNPNGEPESVRYEQINAMLLNEFLKEHRKVEQQAREMRQQRKDFEATIAELKKQIEAVAAHSKKQDANIQRVSAQIDLSRSVTKLADDNQ